MVSQNIFCRMKAYIQPFEKLLALEELKAITNTDRIVEHTTDDQEPVLYSVLTENNVAELKERLTYWESIWVDEAVSPVYYTHQVRYEASSEIARNGILPEELFFVLPLKGQLALNRRRNLRYGSHGIHEYRGKFFPQLVRSLLNISGSGRNSIVVDPMCGSGTTLVEASTIGCTSFGLDMNPLSVLMSQTKTEILDIEAKELFFEYKLLETNVLTTQNINQEQNIEVLPWFSGLPKQDGDYLKRWFASSVLLQLDPITIHIQKIAQPAIHKLFLITLSNILRSVSWQKDDDLRVRKQYIPDTNVDVTRIFLEELQASVKSILAFLLEGQESKRGVATVFEDDARHADMVLSNIVGQVDTIITSPPYATALPYLDTDRLSLSYLNLLSRPKHRKRDYTMIGNREITEKSRQNYLELYRRNKASFPAEISHVIDLIHSLNTNADVGFRRRNLSALLAKYFLDMREVMQKFVLLLRPGGYAYVVIGNNHTTAGGQLIEIATDNLLSQLGESVGLKLEKQVSMEMLVSRDIFKKNAGSAETILCFRR
jgi:DNA modification methylase